MPKYKAVVTFVSPPRNMPDLELGEFEAKDKKDAFKMAQSQCNDQSLQGTVLVDNHIVRV